MEIKIQIECIKPKIDNNYPEYKVSYGEYEEEYFSGDSIEVVKEIKAWLLLKISEIDIQDLLGNLVKE